MPESSEPEIAMAAVECTPKPMGATGYPDPFARRVAGRRVRKLGEAFGLTNFGVNLTELAPGSQSSVMHRHSRQDEFIYVLEGRPTLRTDVGERVLGPGDCAGFPAGGVAHHLVNDTESRVLYLEVGDRTPGDAGEYPEDDLAAVMKPEGGYRFTHKDGSPY
jgi:uncharacterized cupin superfamily protein